MSRPTPGTGFLRWPCVIAMSLFFWIVIAATLGALVLGFILKVRLRDQQVWEELVEPDVSSQSLESDSARNAEAAERYDIDMDEFEQPQEVQGEEMNTQSHRSVRDADLRRSSRIERPVSLIVLGTNRRGEIFQERTSAVAVNLHGCRYSSRHEYAPEGWVTLQVTGTDGASSRPVRARVRSVFSPQTSRELCQVGVELETPGNVWGIAAPPEDWQRLLGASNAAPRAATAVAPAHDPAAGSASFLDRQPSAAERRAEVTVFPGSPAAAAASEELPEKEAPPTKAERVVITAEQLLQALQGKIQLAADKAVQASLSNHIDDAVKAALGKIEDGWKANIRQTEEFSATRLAEVQGLWEKELLGYRHRAEEIARHLEAVTAASQQSLGETQKLAERLLNETTPQLETRLNDSLARANSGLQARAVELSEQHLVQFTETNRLAIRESRSQLDETLAEVRSLSASMGGGISQDRVQSLIDSSRAQTLAHIDKRLGELFSGFEQQHDLGRNRTNEIARQLEGLTIESRQTGSQHEQGLAEVRSLLANTSSGIPQERINGLLDSSREQILSHLEWRLGEVSSHYEQLLGQARHRADQLSEQVDKLTAETRQQFAESRSLAERGSHELKPQDLASIEQSVGHATKEFENAAARVSDRQLIRLMEQKQSVSQELTLELEARASEARALLQKASNNTLEEFRRRVETQIDHVLAEATDRVSSSLASLDAESRAAVESRRRALEADVARAAEQSTTEFRSGIKAFLYSCLVAAVSAVDQHAQTTLAGLSSDSTLAARALDATLNPSTTPDNSHFPPRTASTTP